MHDHTPACKDIAPRLRGLRDALGLSVEEMAELAEAAPEEVAKYETGDHEIPVSYLAHLAQAAKVDLTVLVSGKESHLHNYSLVKKGRGLAVERRKDYDYKSLAYRFTGRRMEPFLITVPPKGGDELNFTSHPGQEFVYAVEGRLEISLDKDKVVLEPGDSLYFSSHIPHALRGLDGKQAVFLDVISG